MMLVIVTVTMTVTKEREDMSLASVLVDVIPEKENTKLRGGTFVGGIVALGLDSKIDWT